ncbi:MAG: hypothetical protein ACQEXX_01345 [Bacillota bacterium]
MEQEMVFDKQFSVTTKEGNQIKFDYFIFEDTPVISYDKWEHSFCTNFENQSWTSNDRPDFSNKGLIFIISAKDPLLDWCSLYHELGHVVNNHPFKSKGRLDKVKDGVVSPYEIEADQHVLRNMGREKTIIWLESIINFLTNEIELREQAKAAGHLQEAGLWGLERYYLSRDEVKLRIKYL